MYKIVTNQSGSRTIEVSESHLSTLERYHLLDQLVGSNGIIDEEVLDKLKLTIRSILSAATRHCSTCASTSSTTAT